jgi:hypothetical protein
LLELGRGHVAEVAVEAFGVEPVDPSERRELDVLDAAPGALSGPADGLGLVVSVDGLGERVVVAVADGSDGGTAPSSASRSP